VFTSLLAWTTSELNMFVNGIEVTAGMVLVPSGAASSAASESSVLTLFV
jgi:hypothetical protein